jgi:hypothetical protein
MSMSRPAIKVIAGVVIACLSSACRINSYVMPSDTPHGWVTIEQGNSTCSAQPGGRWLVSIDIPKARTACTSTPTHLGWELNRYYLAEPDGTMKRLTLDVDIHQRSFFAVGQVGTRCYYSGTQFFLGTSEELAKSTEVAFSPEFKRERHPECL